jgi:hypothetical protein
VIARRRGSVVNCHLGSCTQGGGLKSGCFVEAEGAGEGAGRIWRFCFDVFDIAFLVLLSSLGDMTMGRI